MVSRNQRELPNSSRARGFGPDAATEVVTDGQVVETREVVDPFAEVEALDLAHRHDLHWLAAGQVFEL